MRVDRHDPTRTRPSVNLSEAIYYHDMGLMEKLTYKITAWLRKQAD